MASVQTKTKRALSGEEILKIPKSIIGPVGKAVTEFNMIQEGDHLLLGLSGVKDISIEP